MPRKGSKITKEHRQAIIRSNKTRKVSEETKNKMRLKALGRKYSKETKEKHRKLMIGNDYSFKGDNAINDETYRYRARAIVEKIIGRKLTTDETIHHMDHNPRNNAIDNLYYFKTRAEHSAYHAKLRGFVREELQ